MAGPWEKITVNPSNALMERRPRPKMKASKRQTSTPRRSLSTNFRMQSGAQTPGTSETHPISEPTALPKEQCYDDPVICTFCDDGGQSILSCEGICNRHFHACKEGVADEIDCQTLGYSAEALESMDSFLCENCKQGMHQCFICGELGLSKGEEREVYLCQVESCKKFYHPHCIFTLRGITQTTPYVDQVKTGRMKLFCPRHRCDTCNTEDMSPGRLVQCRRCPRAWHVHCLKDFKISGELPTTEVWEHDKFKYIYCRNHEILEDLKAPRRDHVKFPC